MDPERAEVAVVDPQRLDELVGVGQGVDVGAADPVDVTGSEDGAGRGGAAGVPAWPGRPRPGPAATGDWKFSRLPLSGPVRPGKE
jgi:hypothetical protein